MAFAEPQFELSEDDLDERTHVIAIAGEIHVSTAPRFSVLLDDAIGRGKTAVVLDLSAVEFIDSTGLSVLLNGLRLVSHKHGRMALACANQTVLRLFQITRLVDTFDIFPDRAAAVAHIAGDSSGGAP